MLYFFHPYLSAACTLNSLFLWTHLSTAQHRLQQNILRIFYHNKQSLGTWDWLFSQVILKTMTGEQVEAYTRGHTTGTTSSLQRVGSGHPDSVKAFHAAGWVIPKTNHTFKFQGCHWTFAKITENLRVRAVSQKMNTKWDRKFRKRKMK